MTEAKRVGAVALRPSLRRPSPRAVTVALLGLIYLVLTVGVLSGSDIDGMDTLVFRWAGTKPWPGIYDLVSWWVLLGQRAICCAIAAVWFLWVAVRRRNLRPLLTFVVVTLLLNVTVGVVKLAIGRLGPLQLGQNAGNIGASRVFADGTIFPSGHTSNAVVIWGLMALLAVRHRRVWAAIAGFMAVTVGLSTIYLGTHWVSDVVAGWAAGGLVLLAVPSMTPVIDALERLVLRLVPDRWRRRARLFRWDQNVVLEPVPGLLGVRAQSGRPAQARLADARWTTTDGSTRSRRLRLGDYAEPPRAAASN
jgi:membrane-associated phospholipid phosphatase